MSNFIVNPYYDAITGGASSIVSANLTAGRALASDSAGKVAVSLVTAEELGYLHTAVPVTHGGTGQTKFEANQVLVGNGTGGLKTIPSGAGALYRTDGSAIPQWGVLPVNEGGTGATTAVTARDNLACLGADTTTNPNYPGILLPGGKTDGYIRTPVSGILPYKSGTQNACFCGTSTWPFYTMACETSYVRQIGFLDRTSYRPIRFYDGDENGIGVVIGAGGRTIIGGGESAESLRSALGTAATSETNETMNIASDTVVYVHSNCGSTSGISARKTFTFLADGTFRAPLGLDGHCAHDILRLYKTSNGTNSGGTTKVAMQSSIANSPTAGSTMSVSSGGIKVNKSGKFLVSAQYMLNPTANASAVLAIGDNGDSTWLLKAQVDCTSGKINSVVLPPTLVTLTAGHTYYPYIASYTGTVEGATATTGNSYSTYLQIERVSI